MKYLSLFSGIEAATVALGSPWMGSGGLCRVRGLPQRPCLHTTTLSARPGDVTKITREQIRALGHIDIVVGGSPCQGPLGSR